MLSGLVNNVAPLAAPIVAGYCVAEDVENWRWIFWIALISAGANWPMLIFIPETFAPLILRRLQKEAHAGSQVELENNTSTTKMITVVLTRPLRMLAEPLVFFTDLFLLFQYSVYFLCFEAYPFIFQGVYKFGPGKSALMLIPIGLGGIIAVFIFLWWDRYLARAKARGASWASQEEYRRLPLACAGGPLYAISLFWLGWSVHPSVHWSVPALSGVVYGIGIDLTFMALTNYLTDAYGIFSASALASSVFSRNISAALLVSLASYQLYERLGVDWACTLLGLVCVVLSVVPFAFIKYGPRLKETLRTTEVN